MSRYGSRSEVDFDDRRSYAGGRARHDDRYAEADVTFRTGTGAVPRREREAVLLKERDDYDRRGSLPAFLRDDYGQTNAGAMVLRARDKEDVTYAVPRRRRSPSPEKQERDEIIIRREERSESRPPAPRPRRREGSREREEIIIRRDERTESLPPAPRPRPRPREEEREREEIIIRRDERSDAPPAPRYRERGRDSSREREEIIIRREERSQSRPAAPRYRERDTSREREEIIIRREERDDHYAPPPRSRTAPIRETEREEIIIRRDERDDDNYSRRSYRPPPPPVKDELERQEIIIRRDKVDSNDRARVPARRYEDDLALTRPISHERSRGRSHSSASEDEIIIRRDEREGRRGERSRQEIIIRHQSRSRSPSPTASVSTRAPAPAPPPPAPEPQVIYAPQIHQEVITHHRHVDHGYEVRIPPRPAPVYSRPPSPPSPPPAPPPAPASIRSLSEERIEIRRSEMRNGERETQDIVISRNERSRSRGPPPVRFREDDYREEVDRTEIDIRRERDYHNDRALIRPEPEPEPPTIGPRYGARRDPRDGLWTEITKDLVVKEAIREMGYEFEETDDHYYIFKYMTYPDVARLVGLSEDIRRDRAKRINEIRWENAASPRPVVEPTSPRAPLAIEGPPSRGFRDDRGWNREDERYVEREVVYRGGRPPPPVGWRR
ncbi:hypothetical protein LTR05_006985 [Lithohypha guttulata]|uniref:DUF8035 domain-containing protein n=1 Tax=Lithohypha guttulata TaxID=1690604 RepID=A0AAN7SX96_9EURO|nr:hypothetical protein LTR05_006985 [Lithohypha guttulata]